MIILYKNSANIVTKSVQVTFIIYKLFNEEYFADKIDCFKPETFKNLLPYTQGVNEWIGLFFA